MRRFMIAAVLTAVALPGVAHASGEGWYADFDEAVKVAKKEGKDLLVDLSGSDWCGWCKVLDKEVFKHASFLDAVKKDYVLVLLDFPRGEEAKARVPNPKRNQELFTQWGARGYPTVLLMDVDGNVFGRTGYQRGGPEKYVEHLAELRTAGRPGLVNALAVRKAAEDARGKKKIVALGAVLDLMEKIAEEPFAPTLVPGVKAAMTADPDDAMGLRTRGIRVLLGAGIADDDVKAAVLAADPKNEKGLLALLLGAGNADDDVKAAVLAADPKNEKGLYERFVEAAISRIRSKEQLPGALATIEGLFAAGSIKDSDRAIKFRASAASWCFQYLDEKDKAREHATALKALNPESPRIQSLITRILGE